MAADWFLCGLVLLCAGQWKLTRIDGVHSCEHHDDACPHTMCAYMLHRMMLRLTRLQVRCGSSQDSLSARRADGGQSLEISLRHKIVVQESPRCERRTAHVKSTMCLIWTVFFLFSALSLCSSTSRSTCWYS